MLNSNSHYHIFRPFTFALHSLIGVGFLAATFLVQPFLPEDNSAKSDQNSTESVQDSICSQNVTDITTSSHNELLWGVPKIAWPFIISGSWCMVFCTGFIILSKEIPKVWVKKPETLKNWPLVKNPQFLFDPHET